MAYSTRLESYIIYQGHEIIFYMIDTGQNTATLHLLKLKVKKKSINLLEKIGQ